MEYKFKWILMNFCSLLTFFVLALAFLFFGILYIEIATPPPLKSDVEEYDKVIALLKPIPINTLFARSVLEKN